MLDPGRRITELDDAQVGEPGDEGGGEHADAQAQPDQPDQEVRGRHLEGDITADPGGGERLVGLGAPGRPGGEVDEHLVREAAQADVHRVGQRVPGGDHRHQLAVRQHAAVHAFRPGAARQPEEREVQRALPHPLGQVGAPSDAQRDPHLRMADVEVLQCARQVHRRHRGDGTDGEPAADLAGDRRDLGAGAVRGVEGLPGGGQERLTGRGQPDPAAGPVEEPGAQFAFQPGDLVAQRRLDDPAALGRPGEVRRLRHRDHVAHLLELHRSILDRDQ